MAAGKQVLIGNEFRRDWETQKDLFWQMYWRVPGLRPNTLVLMNEELSYYADNSIGAPLNWIFAPDLTGTQLPYTLFYPTNRLGGSLRAQGQGIPVSFTYEMGMFRGNTSDVVAFYFDPPACLRLLDPILDVDNRFISDDSLMREASTLSNADRILATQEAVMPEIYGPEPRHGWCYYFEKADLARQFGDWETVSNRDYLTWEDRDFPRAKTWDVLLARTGAPGIHFQDDPEMQGLELPEWSHLAASERPRFTETLIRAIERLPPR